MNYQELTQLLATILTFSSFVFCYYSTKCEKFEDFDLDELNADVDSSKEKIKEIKYFIIEFFFINVVPLLSVIFGILFFYYDDLFALTKLIFTDFAIFILLLEIFFFIILLILNVKKVLCFIKLIFRINENM